MAKAPAVIEQRPAHLMKYEGTGFNERFKVPAGAPIGRVSLDAKVFTFLYGGEDWIVQTAAGDPMPYLDVCIIDANENTSKAFWIEGYEQGSSDAPDCASILGVVPDPGVPHPQNATCGKCKWNKFGSAANGRAKACGDSKRLAIVPAWDFENEDWGGPMLFRVPPTSFRNFGEYVDDQTKQGRDLNLIITRIRFDPKTSHQKLMFSFQRWISEDEDPLMAKWQHDEHTKRVLMVNLAGDEEEDEAGAPADPDPAPTQRTTRARADTSANERMAAARAAAQSQANATANEPAPPPKANGSAGPAKRGNAGRVVRPAPTAEEPPKPRKGPQTAEPEVAPPRKNNVVPMEPGQPAKRQATAGATPTRRPTPPPPTEPEPVAEEPAEVDSGTAAAIREMTAEYDNLAQRMEGMDPASPLYKRLYDRAMFLENELDALGALPADDGGEITDADEEVEEAQTGSASTSELLAALDDEDLSGVPS